MKNYKKYGIVLDVKHLEEFLEIYLESDVLMLADIFENFRNNCLKYYHLDPANYVSAPSLSYHAMLLLSKVVIEPYPTLEIYRMLQRRKTWRSFSSYNKIC